MLECCKGCYILCGAASIKNVPVNYAVRSSGPRDSLTAYRDQYGVGDAPSASPSVC